MTWSDSVGEADGGLVGVSDGDPVGVRDGRCVGVRDGIEAIKRFKDEQFDLVILDIMIPGIDGLNVCENIRLKNVL